MKLGDIIFYRVDNALRTGKIIAFMKTGYLIDTHYLKDHNCTHDYILVLSTDEVYPSVTAYYKHVKKYG